MNECSRNGEYKYCDYFVLRVLFSKKASSLTSATNLLVEGDLYSLKCHLHQIVSQASNFTEIKMGVLQHIVVNMQVNNEITSEKASILVDLIKQEDGLVCEAYKSFCANFLFKKEVGSKGKQRGER